MRAWHKWVKAFLSFFSPLSICLEMVSDLEYDLCGGREGEVVVAHVVAKINFSSIPP